MDYLFMALFCACPVGSVLIGADLWKGILLGLVVLAVYTKLKKFTWAEFFGMIREGSKTGFSVSLIFVIIGYMTGLWR